MSTATTETAACAAIRLRDGTVIAGHRHHNCLQMIHTAKLSRFGSEQGFMTTLGRFVGREEGLALQRAAGILSADPGGYRGSILFSEDLY